jgi:serine-type D-Ala-D-Ala carboxypeptidase
MRFARRRDAFVNIQVGETTGETSALAAELQVRLDSLLGKEIDVGSFPGVAYAVGSSSGLVLQRAHGYSVVKPAKIPITVDVIFDVASLTKPLITATMALMAFEEGRIDLDEPVSRYLPELEEGKKEITFIDLLAHRGGFQAWYPLYAHGTGRDAYLQALTQRPLRYRPGTREIYSCLGFILLHLALERVYEQKLEEVVAAKIFQPLGLERTMFNPSPEMKYVVAATEWGNSNERLMVDERGLEFNGFRNYIIWGEVNDGNAYYMGGYAGNAGLFSTAREVFELAVPWIDGRERLISAATIGRALRNYTLGMEENRGLGWQLQIEKPNHPSSVLSRHCFGHTGFTGTSVWVDPERDMVAVLLTNRLHPFVKPSSIQAVRHAFHQAIVEIWDRRGGSRDR